MRGAEHRVMRPARTIAAACAIAVTCSALGASAAAVLTGVTGCSVHTGGNGSVGYDATLCGPRRYGGSEGGSSYVYDELFYASVYGTADGVASGAYAGAGRGEDSSPEGTQRYDGAFGGGSGAAPGTGSTWVDVGAEQWSGYGGARVTGVGLKVGVQDRGLASAFAGEVRDSETCTTGAWVGLPDATRGFATDCPAQLPDLPR